MDPNSGRSEVEVVEEVEQDDVSNWVSEFLQGKLYALISFQISMMYLAVLIVSKVSPLPGMAMLTFCDFIRLFTHLKKRQCPANMNYVHNVVRADMILLNLAEIGIIVYLSANLGLFKWIIVALIILNLISSLIAFGVVIIQRPIMASFGLTHYQHHIIKIFASYFIVVLILDYQQHLVDIGIYMVYFTFVCFSLITVYSMQQKFEEQEQDIRKSRTSVHSFMMIFHLGVILDTFIVQWLYKNTASQDYMSLCLMMQLIFNFIIVLVVWKQYSIWRVIFMYEGRIFDQKPTQKPIKPVRFSLIRVTTNFFKFKPALIAKKQTQIVSQMSTNIGTVGTESKRCMISKSEQQTRLHDLPNPQQSVFELSAQQPGSMKGDEFKCTICFSAIPNTVFYPCGHGGVCFECGTSIHSGGHLCPFCRNPIVEAVQIGSKLEIEVNNIA